MAIYFTDQSNSGVPAGTRKIFSDLSRWLRFASPPANFLRPSGADNNFAEFASSITVMSSKQMKPERWRGIEALYHAPLLREMNRDDVAARLETRADEIRANANLANPN